MTRGGKCRDYLQAALRVTGLIALLVWALIEIAYSALPRDYEFRPRDEVRLVFNPGEFVPAGGLTDEGHFVALRVDERGYVICSPTVYLEIVPK